MTWQLTYDPLITSLYQNDAAVEIDSSFVSSKGPSKTKWQSQRQSAIIILARYQISALGGTHSERTTCTALSIFGRKCPRIAGVRRRPGARLSVKSLRQWALRGHHFHHTTSTINGETLATKSGVDRWPLRAGDRC